jgi:serine/threonine protein kinase
MSKFGAAPRQDDEANKGSVNLKDFNIIERLGKGSFGSVYLVDKKSNS